METCPICNNSLESPPTEVDDVFTVKCQKCGNYKLTSEAQANLKDTFLTERQAANISGWLVENESYEITTKNLDSFLVKLKPPSFTERADKLLSYIAHEAKYPGNPACFGIEYVSRAWCINECEFDEVVNYLIETKRIIHVKGSSLLRKVKVSSQGWIRLEELSKRNPESSQGFVAMWFNDTIKPLYGEAIAPAIRDAGYTPHRVDAREHNDKIDDEIILQGIEAVFILKQVLRRGWD
ncbi:MAG: hypothetical protein HZB37_04680 [Planctomycetes bacterium]|nr:hypothetical protein [Planctomycetota bacterium]